MVLIAEMLKCLNGNPGIGGFVGDDQMERAAIARPARQPSWASQNSFPELIAAAPGATGVKTGKF
jgi:hypothetical protein